MERDPSPAKHHEGPLMVVTSRLSASAPEILAGALQDYGRAEIVSDPATFGEGPAQSVSPQARVIRNAGLTVAGMDGYGDRRDAFAPRLVEPAPAFPVAPIFWLPSDILELAGGSRLYEPGSPVAA